MSRYAARHRQSVTELLLDGLTWRLEQDDPRRESMGDMKYYDNTVIQELVKPAHLLDALIPFDEDFATFQESKEKALPDILNYDNTVIQENASAKRPGRPGTMRETILDLLRAHPEGLSAEQIQGRELRYFIAYEPTT
jgi:hypothetical protein